MNQLFIVLTLLAVALGSSASSARADDGLDEMAEEGSAKPLPPRLMLAPSALQAGWYLLAPPAELQDLAGVAESGWRFDFHGAFLTAFSVGASELRDPQPGQSALQLHTPAKTAGRGRKFDYAAHGLPTWSQLNFSFGNSTVTATVIIAATNFSAAGDNSAPDPAGGQEAQLGFNQAFLTVRFPNLISNGRANWYVGVVPLRYGAPTTYDLGRYQVALFGNLKMVGETLSLEKDLGDAVTLQLDHGVGGRLRLGPSPTTGGTAVHHVHFGAVIARRLQLAAHHVYILTNDAKRNPAGIPDPNDPSMIVPDPGLPSGHLAIYGADARWMGALYGTGYLGFAHVEAKNATRLDDAVDFLRANPVGASADYWGSEGNGAMNVLSMQYSLSIGTLARHPRPFWGEGPDLVVNLFGLLADIQSRAGDDNTRKALTRTAWKAGAELIYTPRPWLGLVGRVDRVVNNANDPNRSFWVLSPGILLRTAFISHEYITLRYIRYALGDAFTRPSELGVVAAHDSDVIDLSVFMWW